MAILPPDTRMETLLTAREVACYLKLSKSKVYYMIQTKKIPHVRIGRNVRIKETDLKAWLENNTITIPYAVGSR